MMFYLPNEDGTASGPHSVGAVRRALESGSVQWDTLVCAYGTEDWLPASVFADVLEEKPSVASLVCSHCGAAEVQRVKAIYETGTVQSETRGMMVGGYGDLGDGNGFDGTLVGGSRSRTTTSSLLAQRCAPPLRDDYVEAQSIVPLLVAIVSLVIGIFMILVGKKGFGVSLIVLAVLALALTVVDPSGTKRRKEQARYFRQAQADWERRYYCHRCGQMGDPVKRVQ